MMGHSRTLCVIVLGLMLATAALGSQSGPRYRDYQLGSDLVSVSAVAGTPASDAKVIHQRPALLQDLQWRRPYTFSGATAVPVDPVARQKKEADDERSAQEKARVANRAGFRP